LQNGKKPPASDELNVAIAKITGNDPIKLLMAAYINKAPDNIKALLSGYLDMSYNKNNFNNQLSKAAYEVEMKFPGFTKGIYQEDELLKEDTYRKYKQLSKQFLEKHFKEPIDITSEDRKIFHQKRSLEKPLTVPIMRFIKRNEPVFSVKHICGWTIIPKQQNLSENEVLLLKVPDNLMEDSRIQHDDIVIVKITSDIKDGDIVLLNVEDDDAIIRKISNINNGTAWIYPSNNKNFEPIFIRLDSVRIIGKVIQVIVNL
jgi:SOS-response transcriptional repressor LexA